MAKKKGRKPTKKRKTSSKPFANKPRKKPPSKRKNTSTKRSSKGRKRSNSKTRALAHRLWKEVTGLGIKWDDKDWAQRIFFIIFLWFPMLLFTGIVNAFRWWAERKSTFFRVILFPPMIIGIFIVFMFLFVGWLQLLVFLAVPILILFNFVVLWWIHRIANDRRKKADASLKGSARYAKVFPGRTSSMPRVTPRRSKK